MAAINWYCVLVLSAGTFQEGVTISIKSVQEIHPKYSEEIRSLVFKINLKISKNYIHNSDKLSAFNRRFALKPLQKLESIAWTSIIIRGNCEILFWNTNYTKRKPQNLSANRFYRKLPGKPYWMTSEKIKMFCG